jgi:hypothetical protein
VKNIKEIDKIDWEAEGFFGGRILAFTELWDEAVAAVNTSGLAQQLIMSNHVRPKTRSVEAMSNFTYWRCREIRPKAKFYELL